MITDVLKVAKILGCPQENTDVCPRCKTPARLKKRTNDINVSCGCCMGEAKAYPELAWTEYKLDWMKCVTFGELPVRAVAASKSSGFVYERVDGFERKYGKDCPNARKVGSDVVKGINPNLFVKDVELPDNSLVINHLSNTNAYSCDTCYKYSPDTSKPCECGSTSFSVGHL